MTDENRPTDPEEMSRMLKTLLDIEQLDTDLYRGSRKPGGVGRVFGGQVIAQGLQAAQRSIDEDKIAHSLHAYFMRPGDEDYPIIFRVVRDFDGGSFANRRVIAMQKGKPILNMTASFQRPEEGLHHQYDMPDVPPPEDLRTDADLAKEVAEQLPEDIRNFLLRPRPIELRPVNQEEWRKPRKRAPRQQCWIRAIGSYPDDPALHRAMLAYASDMILMSTAMLPHGVNSIANKIQGASLDHALWLHEPLRADEWLLYSTDSPWSGHARGFNRGEIFTREGRLVASVAQEGLIRLRD